MSNTVGLDLGGTKVLGALVTPDGSVAAEERRPTPDTGDDLIEMLVELVEALGGAGAGVGVGAAGMIGRDGSVRYGPNVEAFRAGFPLAARLRERLGVAVRVDNDANAAAWGEFVHGAAAPYDDALVITLGTGIGGGVIVGGELLRGAHGYAAEVGHFQVTADGPECACGERGHWEALASGTALGRLAEERLRLSGEELGRRAVSGDGDARAVLGEFAGWVAVGLAGLTNILDPEVIVIGGGLVDLGEALLEPVRAEFEGRVEAPRAREAVPIVPAALGERAGAIGAAALVREETGG